jgi:hypothetical protein
LDSGTTVNPTKKKKPKRFGLYKEGKTMMEKIVKETFSPDDVERANKPVKEVVKNAPKKDERFEGTEEKIMNHTAREDIPLKGALVNPERVTRKKKLANK